MVSRAEIEKIGAGWTARQGNILTGKKMQISKTKRKSVQLFRSKQANGRADHAFISKPTLFASISQEVLHILFLFNMIGVL